MPELVVYLAIFVGLGAFFLFFHLLLGKLIRPAVPDEDKLTIYECGEPTIGSAWVQFDLRYYVVALLFVIFDVEVAFFFPWAIVFGKATNLARENLPPKDRAAISRALIPDNAVLPGIPNTKSAITTTTIEMVNEARDETKGISAAAGRSFAMIAFIDILVFFGVLLVGFAYLWRRGDIEWVRSVRAEVPEATVSTPPLVESQAALVGAGRG